MRWGLMWAGAFLAVLGAWYALDTRAAARRWSLRKRDLLSSLPEATYIRVTRVFGIVSIVAGLVLVAVGALVRESAG